MRAQQTKWLFVAGVLALSLVAVGATHPWPQGSSQPAPDNTKTNQDRSAPTADQQKMNTADRETTRNIRKSIMADKSLSTYGHNVKVITQNGKVSLRGPVHSNQEKENVESKAAAVAGKENVTSYVDIVPSK
jgi:hyperosmotically inducible periplasmic protein